jgi:uncharacterized protein Yka (UPF0111/DUF47 family)
LRTRADRSLKDLETRGRRVVESFEKQVIRVADVARKGLHSGRLDGLPAVAKRLRELEQRIEQIEREMRESLQSGGV